MGTLALIVAGVVTFGIVRTRRMERSSHQKEFHKGKVPETLPDGFHKGSAEGYGGSWKGKTFARKTASGVNVFQKQGKKKQSYPFQIYKAKGLRDAKKDVLRIDYDHPANPFWVRLILDEMVQVGKNTYLGKVHVRLIPGLPFTVGFFRLSK